MKVLFVSSGNSGKVKVIVKKQAVSLIKKGIEIDHYLIKGKKVRGYLLNFPKLKKTIAENNYNIIHSHYSLSGFITALATRKPIIASLMGSDAYQLSLYRFAIKIFSRFIWKKTIVKSSSMKELLKIKDAVVIPNGVDLELFKPIEKDIAKFKIQFKPEQKIILFVADPSRKEKNFRLAQNACKRLNQDNIYLIHVYNLPHEKIAIYLNAADVLILTSLWEGSPNIVKEAMACNCPVVSTNVGDVEWLFGNEPGHFLTTFEPEDVAEKIEMALEFTRVFGRTNGRRRVLELGLDAEMVARRLVGVYEGVLGRR